MLSPAWSLCFHKLHVYFFLTTPLYGDGMECFFARSTFLHTGCWMKCAKQCVPFLYRHHFSFQIKRAFSPPKLAPVGRAWVVYVRVLSTLGLQPRAATASILRQGRDTVPVNESVCVMLQPLPGQPGH